MNYADDECICAPGEFVYNGCMYSFLRTCGQCGGVFGSNHCRHDGVQRPSHCCGWMAEGTQTPLQFLGWNDGPP